jgi:hypothetical protein
MSLPFESDHWLPGFNFNVEEWDAKGMHYETLAICRTFALARAAFDVAVKENRAEPLRWDCAASWNFRPY